MVQFEVQLFFGTVTRFVSHEMLIFNWKSFTVSIIWCLFAYAIECAVLKTSSNFKRRNKTNEWNTEKKKLKWNNTLLKRVLSFVESLLFPTHSLKLVGRNKRQRREMENEEQKSIYMGILGKMMNHRKVFIEFNNRINYLSIENNEISYDYICYVRIFHLNWSGMS